MGKLSRYPGIIAYVPLKKQKKSHCPNNGTKQVVSPLRGSLAVCMWSQRSINQWAKYPWASLDISPIVNPMAITKSFHNVDECYRLVVCHAGGTLNLWLPNDVSHLGRSKLTKTVFFPGTLWALQELCLHQSQAQFSMCRPAPNGDCYHRNITKDIQVYNETPLKLM